MQNLSSAQFDNMAKLVDRRSPVLASSVGEMGEQNERIAQRFNQRGVQRMMAIPLTKPQAGSCMTTPQVEGEVVEMELELGVSGGLNAVKTSGKATLFLRADVRARVDR